LTASGCTELVRGVPVDDLTPACRVPAQAAADLDDPGALFTRRDLELVTRRKVRRHLALTTGYQGRPNRRNERIPTARPYCSV
jgi:hypothetical protein